MEQQRLINGYLSRLRDRHRESSDTVLVLETHVSLLEEDLAKATAEIAVLENNKSSFETKIAELESAAATLTLAMENARSSHEAEMNEMRAAARERAAADVTAVEQQSSEEVEHYKNECKRLSQDCEKLGMSLNETKNAQHAAEARAAKLDLSVERDANRIDALLAELERAKSVASDLESELNALRAPPAEVNTKPKRGRKSDAQPVSVAAGA